MNIKSVWLKEQSSPPHMHLNCLSQPLVSIHSNGFMFAFVSGDNDNGLLYVPCSLIHSYKTRFPVLHNTHTSSFAWIMTFSFWRSPTFQSSLGGDRAGSLTSAIQGQCGRQAGKQLYYSSGMAGSAEGEAPTPILMRLYAAQWPSVCRRIRQKQSHSYQRTYCLVETLLSLRHSEKKLTYLLSSLSISPQLLEHLDKSVAH